MQLNYKAFGEGFPVIILHGLFGSLDNWQTTAKKLAGEFKVFTVDQRNHGRSPHSEEHSYILMADDLKAFIRELGIRKAHLIGHSMGGKTAMQFAISYSDMVEKLVIVDIAPRAYVESHKDIFQALLKLDLDQIIGRDDAGNKLTSWIKAPRVRQFLLKNLQRTENGGYNWKFNLHGIYRNYSNVNVEITAEQQMTIPTLVVYGGNSDYITTTDKAHFKTMFSNVRFKSIPDAGHWLHADKPRQFLDTVISFISASL